jgi:uncharacterized membrane protein YidH (DUF202 family)
VIADWPTGSLKYVIEIISTKRKKERRKVMGIILIIILVLLLIGALPTWGHSKSWGPYPSGGIGLILLILIILVLMGRI